MGVRKSGGGITAFIGGKYDSVITSGRGDIVIHIGNRIGFRDCLSKASGIYGCFGIIGSVL